METESNPRQHCAFCEEKLGPTYWPATTTIPVSCMRCGGIVRLAVDRELDMRKTVEGAFIKAALDMDRFIRECLKEKRWTRDDMADVENAFVAAAHVYRVSKGKAARRDANSAVPHRSRSGRVKP